MNSSITQNSIRNAQYELFDTHAHLAFEPLINDIDNVLQRSIAAGVTHWITVGTNIEESRKSVALAEKYDNLYAAIGVHPHDAKDVTEENINELEELARNKKVVAIGETGLDFHYNFSPPQIQKEVFKKHLALAAGLNLPVIIHSREAFDETMQTMEQQDGCGKIVFHCFTGSADQAKMILDKGFYISLTGAVTFKNADEIRQAAKIIPADRLMLETDCPYMSPEPVRKQKTNEPALMLHTAKFLADLRGVTLENLAKSTTASAREFFSITA
ncbi:MAG: TatD family hydrolase [Phycisphaerae bacterium]|jgi:TatD DNase family protein